MWTCLYLPPWNWQVGFIGVGKLKWSNSQRKWRVGKSYPVLWATCSICEVHKQHSIGSVCIVYGILQGSKFSMPELLACTKLRSTLRFIRTTSCETEQMNLCFCGSHPSPRVIRLPKALPDRHKIRNRKSLSLVHFILSTFYPWRHPMKQGDFAMLHFIHFECQIAPTMCGRQGIIYQNCHSVENYF